MNIGNVSVGVEVDTSKMNEGLVKAASKVSTTDSLFAGFVITLNDLMNVGNKLASVFKSIVEAAGESELVTKQLSDAMKAQNIYTDEALQLNLDYATSLSQTTKYTDEQIASTMKLLTNFGLHDEQLREVTKSTLDLATRTGSLDSAATLLGKAFQGETGRLAMVGIQLDDNIPKSKEFGEVMRKVRENFGGTAAGEADTYVGSMQQMKNEFGELAEVIGNSGGVLDAMTDFNKNIKQLTISMKQELPGAIDGVKSAFKKMAESAAVKPFLDMFNKINQFSANTAKAIEKNNVATVASVKTNADKIVSAKKTQSNAELDIIKKQKKEEEALAKSRMDYEIYIGTKTLEDKKRLLESQLRNVAKGSKEEIALLKELAEVSNQVSQKSIAGGWKLAFQDIKNSALDWKAAFLSIHSALQSSLSTALASMVLEGQNFGDAMGTLWEAMKVSVVGVITDMAAQWIVKVIAMGAQWVATHVLMVAATESLTTTVVLFETAAAPLLIVIVAIAAAFLILKNNWQTVLDTFSGTADNPLSWLVKWFNEILEVVQKLIDKIQEMIDKIKNIPGNAWEDIKKGATDIAEQAQKDTQNLIDDISDIVSIKFAGGVRNFQGGLAVVGEAGPELVNLPQGSDVVSNANTKSLFSQARSSGGGQNISIVINAQVRSDEDWEKVTRGKIIPALNRYMKKTANSPFA